MSDLYFRQIKVGPMANFCYLIGSISARRCLAVDPAWDIPAVSKVAQQDGMTVEGILVTHYHPDHIGGRLWGYDIAGVSDFIATHPVPIYAQKPEVEGIVKVTGLSRSDIKAQSSGDKISVGGIEVTLVHTPGHTPGSQCFLINERLVSGDTLFISGCGRVDLPGGDGEALYHSLHEKILTLPRETLVYPGHDYDDRPCAPLSHVLSVNPYLKVESFDEWKHLRMS